MYRLRFPIHSRPGCLSCTFTVRTSCPSFLFFASSAFILNTIRFPFFILPNQLHFNHSIFLILNLQGIKVRLQAAFYQCPARAFYRRTQVLSYLPNPSAEH